MANILIVGKGGFGDLFPLFAIAEELIRRGHAVRVAAEPHHAAACAQIGAAHRVLDSAAPPRAGSLRAQLAATLDPSALATEVRTLEPLARGADLMLGNQLAYAGAIVRDLLGTPWAFCAASPLALPSRFDAPLWPYLHPLQRAAAAIGLPQAAFIGPARAATRALMRAQTRLRRELGVDTHAHPRFEALYSQRLNLLPVSPLLLQPQPDWPAHTRLSGFAWFESTFLGDQRLADELAAFAAAGAPPVVLAPGGSARGDPLRFLERGVAACRAVGRRAIVVAAPRLHAALPAGDDVRPTGYLPYARLFGLGAAVLHSGGIGTLGWAMRAGVPSLLLPGDWDQYDNARLAQRAGVGAVLGKRADTACDAAVLDALLGDDALHQRLRRLAPQVAAENGAAVACDAIEAII
ncbi:4'-demethylrebeccamycin synthase [mine drainage metagenome]|jgi:UDP:flavonoid glycosyltransferase YjiC (YdhE family)|uniref:4'-demethylrebeccamycin synthase n=1 Tax=mine drainage metagenome TaxID=410659 RepID=A0A1J5QVD3_9ZZZZ